MRAITEFVGALSLPEALKEELAGDYILRQHQLYVQLPTWLAPVFGPAVSAAHLDQLSISCYFYFRFLLAIDKVLDAGPVADSAAPALSAQRLLTYCELYERSIRGLASLFPPTDPYWAGLDACKKQYADSNLREKAFSAARGPFTRESFEALAIDKSAVCHMVVFALSSLGKTTTSVAPLIDCLNHLHVALQCMDDVDDFRTDWEQGQYTYAHAQVEAYLLREAIDVQALDAARVHPYLYTSGTATALYELGKEHFSRAVAIARPLGLGELCALLEHQSQRCAFYCDDIAAKLSKAQARVTPSPAAVA